MLAYENDPIGPEKLFVGKTTVLLKLNDRLEDVGTYPPITTIDDPDAPTEYVDVPPAPIKTDPVVLAELLMPPRTIASEDELFMLPATIEEPFAVDPYPPRIIDLVPPATRDKDDLADCKSTE